MTDRSFQSFHDSLFVPLCRALGLADNSLTDDGPYYAIASAAAANVRVFFEHDRGLCLFSLGSAYAERPLCSVDTIATRFPRIRILPEGEVRLSLDEQVRFIEGHWTDLQTMFSPEQLADALAWHSAIVAAITKKYSGGN